MDFVNFAKDLFLNFPTNLDQFIDNPYPVVLLVFLLFLILRGKFGFLFYFLVGLTIFLFGLFYGFVNPIAEKTVSILIFSVCSIIAFGLLIFKLLVKSN